MPNDNEWHRFYTAPAPPAESQLLQAERFTLFLGLNFFKLELNQVGRKLWGPHARAMVFLSKFNFNIEARGLGAQLSG